VVRAHIDDLVGQLARIIADGVTRGQLTAADPATAGRAVFDATARFHNPTHAPEWADPSIDAAFAGVKSLVLRGLGARAAEGGFVSWCSPPPPLRLQALKDRRRMLWASGRSWRSGHVDNLAGDVASLLPRQHWADPAATRRRLPVQQGSPDSLLANLQAARVAIDLAGELFRG
jgi:hypothetical protein